ncbi:MAG: hypothetical protein K8R68_10300 [Bacteroidales bacterium]|nr:hypothetical protein [Bacteroidales bacterium]
METFFDKGFESNRIVKYLKNKREAELKSIIDKTFKMTHVGFSRPTHLLCFAINI